MIILEEFNFFTFLLIFKYKKKIDKKSKIYFIYSIKTKYKILFYILKFFKLHLIQLNFELINIREKDNELTKLKIYRKDLFLIEEIFNHQNYFNTSISSDKKEYIVKKTINGNFYLKYSVPKTIWLIRVVEKIFFNEKEIYLILNNRPFKDIFYQFIEKNSLLKLNIIFTTNFIYQIKILLESINFSFKYLKLIYFNFNNKNIQLINNYKKILCLGENEWNIFDKNKRTDFFWIFGTDFPLNQIIYNTSNIKLFNQYKKKIAVTYNNKLKKFKKLNTSDKFQNIYFKKDSNIIDHIYLKKNIKNYNFDKLKILNYIQSNKVKLTFNWDKYTEQQLIINECMKETNGISTVWQMAFDGNTVYDAKSSADINFAFSNFSANNEVDNKSKFKYQLITGMPNNFVNDEIKLEAKNIRNKLFINGAKKIVCVFDENSSDDPRWHTGNDLQISNYVFILNELLKNPSLGVVFKPKVPYRLKSRLGDSYSLIIEALSTGRCHIFDINQKIKAKSSTLAITAALTSDLVIHSHLSAGTAAIESYLIGKPTLLIDREKCTSSILQQLPKNKVVFDNWDDLINELNANLFLKDNLNEFGNWGEFIKILDPYRDNNGHKRIGHVLKEILLCFNKDMKKNDIIEQILINYKKEWGKNSVISNYI